MPDPVVLRLFLALVVVGLIATRSASAAQPDSGPCSEGEDSPTCDFTYGDLVFVADGDTIDVDIAGVGVRRVRLTGVNAMEQTVYSRDPARRRGACHAVEATARLERLLQKGGGRVRLAAQNPESMAGRRLRRQVSTRVNGSWIDTGRVLVSEGLALWLPHGVEYAWNRTYRELSEQAAASRRRLFDRDACGSGPAAGVSPELELRWDAAGNDGLNVNGEWATIRNPSPHPMALAGWWFRDSSARRFTFPSGAVIPPDGDVRLRVGRGSDASGEFHWGLPGPAFENASGGERAMGDGAYLFDPLGNLRAWSIYPSARDTTARWPTRAATTLLLVVLSAAVLALIRRRV